MKLFIRFLFNRITLALIFLSIQLFILIGIIYKFKDYFILFYEVSMIVSIILLFVVRLRSWLVLWQVTDQILSRRLWSISNSVGSAAINEKESLICGESNKTILKNMKHSVSRLILLPRDHRHRAEYKASNSIGTNDNLSGDSIVITTRMTATYNFKR